MTFKSWLAFLPLALALAACASGLERSAEKAQTAMIGMSEGRLQACAGQPTAIHRDNGIEIWNYFRETHRSATAQSDIGYTPTGRGETSYDYFRYCDATFYLRGGRVQALEFKGRTSAGRATLEPCGAIVQRCVQR
ncbi:MAG TPA: hypothetical protein VF194_11015 [Ferrovibrio sp.]|jgi:hypothetical protein|uniref:hypothetical protein n=1 Tax=Ferrovibrio sp. TaxID=1917215 RepID=UPI002ED388AE